MRILAPQLVSSFTVKASSRVSRMCSRAALAFPGLGVAVALFAFAYLASFKLPPGAPLAMSVLRIFDPFLRFPSSGGSVFFLSFAFNALYYFGVGLAFQRVLRKQWPALGKVVLIGAVAGVLNVSLQAMFAACEYVLTGQLVVT
jgi:hypothetical protein